MGWLHALRERTSSLFRGTVRDRELDEEIRFHLDLETARQVQRGAAPDAARVRALAAFGNPHRIADATRAERGAQLMEGGMQDIRWAARSLRKQAGFTTLALVTLALGIGATTVAFTVLDTVLLRPLPYGHPEQLVLIRERTDKQRLIAPSYPNFDDWRHDARSFSGVVSAMYPQSSAVFVGTDPFRASLLGISRDFFEVLEVKPVSGRTFTADENRLGGPCVLMVSEAFWRSAMQRRDPLGTLRVGDTACEVVGVVPDGFRLGDAYDIFFPHEQGPGTVRSAHNYRVIARLAPGVTLDQARGEMTSLSARLLQKYGNDTQAVDADVTPLREYLVGNYRLLLTSVFGAAALVLIIACTNLLSAQLARGMQREHEVAVRAALGAARRRIVRLLFVESSALALTGAALGVGFAAVLLRVVRILGAGLVPRLEELSVDGSVLAFAAAVTVLTSIAVGLYPAYRLSEEDPGRVLRGAAREGGSTIHAGVWRLLIGFEVAMAVVLVTGSGLLIRTLHKIVTADTGVDPHGVVTVEFSPGPLGLPELERVQSELSALPGVSGAAFSSQVPFQWGNYAAPVLRPGDAVDHDWPAFAGFRVVSDNYFSVLRQRLLRGRAFTKDDREDGLPVAVVTPGVAAALWPGADPLGKRVASNYTGSSRWYTVVGVVSEAKSWTMTGEAQNEIYVPIRQRPGEARSHLVAFVRGRGEASALIPEVRSRMRALAPDVPVAVSTLDVRIAQSASDRRFAAFALVLFGAIALILAGVGIYGVMSYTVATRRHEIGLRLALGATPGHVQRRMLADAAVMAGGGVAAGTLIAGGATRLLQSVLFGVSHLDPIAYGGGAVLLVVAALLGAYIPARRSSLVDPAVTLRGEE